MMMPFPDPTFSVNRTDDRLRRGNIRNNLVTPMSRMFAACEKPLFQRLMATLRVQIRSY